MFSLVTVAVGFVLSDAFIALGEDDALGLLAMFLGEFWPRRWAYWPWGPMCSIVFLIAATSGGGWALRLPYAAVVNSGPRLPRIGFCWVRYLFYDFGAEAVDFAFRYTETLEGARRGERVV